MACAALRYLAGRSWTPAFAGVAALLWALFTSPATAQPTGRFIDLPTVATREIAPPHVTIWLPPGYDSTRTRYAVAYMNDGQNVFFSERSGFNKVWAADEAVLTLVAQRRIAPVIVVAVDHPGDARYRQYFPQALYERASPALRTLIERDAHGPITGDAYLRFLTHDLKPLIDRTYRTRADPAHTAIVGSSMGGLISCYAFVRYPRVFGRAACVSTHWPLIAPEDVGTVHADVADLWQSYLARNLGRPDGRRLWMDHGTETLDAVYGPWQDAIDADLTRLGWRRGQDFVSRTYPGAAHEENAWAARLPDIFAWLFG